MTRRYNGGYRIPVANAVLIAMDCYYPYRHQGRERFRILRPMTPEELLAANWSCKVAVPTN